MNERWMTKGPSPTYSRPSSIRATPLWFQNCRIISAPSKNSLVLWMWSKGGLQCLAISQEDCLTSSDWLSPGYYAIAWPAVLALLMPRSSCCKILVGAARVLGSWVSWWSLQDVALGALTLALGFGRHRNT
ncbi:hypothetical protein LZ31DRAFT_392837 [Colletotrichum somersetense]|nr:hypothetical protein LZ31DRAFT_392837 [Colletotrichum somersetense]